MDNNHIYIVYDGCLVSGRQLSILTIIDPINLNEREIVRNNDIVEFRFNYTKDSRQYHVIVTETRIRSQLYYEDPLNSTLASTIVHEIERLCMCDGIIFVIDSRIARKDHNLYAFEKLKRDLASREVDIDLKPIVFQANKRDLEEICSMEWVKENFRTQRCDYVESIATQGIGTREALDKLFELML